MAVIQSTSDEGKGLLAHVQEGLTAHHSPDLFHLQREGVKELCPCLNADGSSPTAPALGCHKVMVRGGILG